MEIEITIKYILCTRHCLFFKLNCMPIRNNRNTKSSLTSIISIFSIFPSSKCLAVNNFKWDLPTHLQVWQYNIINFVIKRSVCNYRSWRDVSERRIPKSRRCCGTLVPWVSSNCRKLRSGIAGGMHSHSNALRVRRIYPREFYPQDCCPLLRKEHCIPRNKEGKIRQGNMSRPWLPSIINQL